MLTFKLILERKNSNNKAVCNEMFDLYVDGTKIEISRFSSDLNVPLTRYIKIFFFIRLYMPANDFLETTPRTGWIYVSLGDGEYNTN